MSTIKLQSTSDSISTYNMKNIFKQFTTIFLIIPLHDLRLCHKRKHQYVKRWEKINPIGTLRGPPLYFVLSIQHRYHTQMVFTVSAAGKPTQSSVR